MPASLDHAWPASEVKCMAASETIPFSSHVYINSPITDSRPSARYLARLLMPYGNHEAVAKLICRSTCAFRLWLQRYGFRSRDLPTHVSLTHRLCDIEASRKPAVVCQRKRHHKLSRLLHNLQATFPFHSMSLGIFLHPNPRERLSDSDRTPENIFLTRWCGHEIDEEEWNISISVNSP
jgi:hypothetical protein